MADSPEDQAALLQGSTFVWHELNTNDIEGSIKFYTETLDFGTTKMEMGEMGPYHMLTRNGRPCCGVTTPPMVETGAVPPHWSTYIAVDDVDATLEKVEAAGGATVVPAMDILTVGRMALIRDKQGAHVWIFKPSM
jgi:predicted enzyme related to lactoylglutathione lyase